MIRIDPAREAITLREAMDRLFDDALWAPTTERRARAATPRANAWEDEDVVTLELELPGVDPASVEITYEQGALLVAGQYPEREEGRTWVLAERPTGRFERRFALSLPVDADKAEARYEAGVLRLSLPKREEVKPRRIEVKIG